MKRFIAIISICFISIFGGIALADSGNEAILYNFEEFTSNNIYDVVQRDESSRTDYSIDTAGAQSGNALRITLGGPEIESSSLSIPVGSRNWSDYKGVKLYIRNATAAKGINIGMHFLSRANNGNEYSLYITSPKLVKTDGSATEHEMRNKLIVLPEDFSGWFLLPFDNAVQTDENGETTTQFNFTNIVSMNIDIDPAGVDLADSAIVMDSISVYKDEPIITPSDTTPIITPNNTDTGNDYTPAPGNVTDEPDNTYSKNNYTASIILLISGIVVTLAALGFILYLIYNKKKNV